jgi:hypothetical protein
MPGQVLTIVRHWPAASNPAGPGHLLQVRFGPSISLPASSQMAPHKALPGLKEWEIKSPFEKGGFGNRQMEGIFAKRYNRRGKD